MRDTKLLKLIVLQITINCFKEISGNFYQFGPTTPRLIRVRNKTQARTNNHRYFVYDFVSIICIIIIEQLEEQKVAFHFFLKIDFLFFFNLKLE